MSEEDYVILRGPSSSQAGSDPVGLTPLEGEPADDSAALRGAAMLLAAWVQRNGYDAFKWRGKVTSEEETEAFTLEVRLSDITKAEAGR